MTKSITHGTAKALLRRSVALLDRVKPAALPAALRDVRTAVLADVAAAVGVSGTKAAVEALGRGPGQRGPDRGPRRKAGEKPLDYSPASDIVSP